VKRSGSSRTILPFLAAVAAASGGSFPGRASAGAPEPVANGDDKKTDYVTRRLEPAGFPLIGGNSDIGFQVGAAATLSYFANGIKPYAWNQDVNASLSVKGGPHGVEIAQQAYQWNIDWVGLLGGRLRLNPQTSYTRTINQGYFGLGNASTDAIPNANPDPSGFHEFVENVFLLRTIARISLEGPLFAMAGASYRYVVPQTPAATRLSLDETVRTPSGSPILHGTRPLSLASLATGLAYDSRDDEIFTTRGVYDVVGVRLEQGIPFDDDVRYGEVGAILTGFVPVAGPVVFAGRFIANFQFGNVPFFDLLAAGPFQLKELPGGSAGIRGVPVGRYLGPVKVVANAELRSMFAHFTVFKQRIGVGSDAFLDVGRIWSDYTFRSPLDGQGLGIKYGAGGGMYWMWGQAAIFRIEVAYSPDANAENRGIPIGVYVEDGTMF
jgi:Omp85 superfamily domain